MKFKRTVKDIERNGAELGWSEKDIKDRLAVYYFVEDGAIDYCHDLAAQFGEYIGSAIDFIKNYGEINVSIDNLSKEKADAITSISNNFANIKLMLNDIVDTISDLK